MSLKITAQRVVSLGQVIFDCSGGEVHAISDLLRSVPFMTAEEVDFTPTRGKLPNGLLIQ